MQNEKQLTIAIISYNSFDVIQRCLADLIEKTGHSVVIADNASPDGSGKKLQARFPECQVLQLDKNLGYGRAANRIIAMTDTPFLLLLNPDLIASNQAVDNLLESAKTQGDSCAIMAPAVTTMDYIQKGLVKRDWVIGAAMLLNLNALKPVGFFDENIFLFSEETDLCFRARKAELGIWLNTSIFIEHLYRQSSTPSPTIEALKNWHIGWSQMYFHAKHGIASGSKKPARVLAKYAIKSMTSTSKQKRDQYKNRFRGTLAFLQGKSAFNPDGTPRT